MNQSIKSGGRRVHHQHRQNHQSVHPSNQSTSRARQSDPSRALPNARRGGRQKARPSPRGQAQPAQPSLSFESQKLQPNAQQRPYCKAKSTRGADRVFLRGGQGSEADFANGMGKAGEARARFRNFAKATRGEWRTSSQRGAALLLVAVGSGVVAAGLVAASAADGPGRRRLANVTQGREWVGRVERGALRLAVRGTAVVVSSSDNIVVAVARRGRGRERPSATGRERGASQGARAGSADAGTRRGSDRAVAGRRRLERGCEDDGVSDWFRSMVGGINFVMGEGALRLLGR